MRAMKRFDALKYAGHVIFHPLDGFWDLKNEKRGNLATALFFLGMTVVTFVLGQRYTGFIFNPRNPVKLNIFMEIGGVLLLYVLWTTANWCLTSLMDGKGTYREILIATGYALVPYVIINLPLIFISGVMIQEEGTFYYFFTALSMLWTAMLLIAGTMMTHDYSLAKTLGTIVCILVGMGIMAFLLLLLASIVQEMVNLVYCVYNELAFRI